MKLLYTIFCKKCDWSREIGFDGMPMDQFCRILKGTVAAGCEKCGERKTFIKNNDIYRESVESPLTHEMP